MTNKIQIKKIICIFFLVVLLIGILSSSDNSSTNNPNSSKNNLKKTLNNQDNSNNELIDKSKDNSNLNKALLSSKNPENYSKKILPSPKQNKLHNSDNSENNPPLNENNSNKINSPQENNSEILIDLDEIVTSNKTPEPINNFSENATNNGKNLSNISSENTTNNASKNEKIPSESALKKHKTKEIFMNKTKPSNTTETSNQQNISLINDSDDLNLGANPKKTDNSFYEDGKNKILTALYKNGKKEIEYFEQQSLNKSIEIHKEETLENPYRKKIKVYSEEHFNESLRVYTDLPSETKKELIKIYWKNEGVEITHDDKFKTKFYDENNNGLIDRVSWIVPHLSEQFFEVIINLSNIEENSTLNSSLNLYAQVITDNKGNTTNPIKFSIQLQYYNLSKISCSLSIDNSIEKNFNISEEKSLIPLNSVKLENGIHSWEISCFDKNDNSIKNSSSGQFGINEDFSISLENPSEKVYLIKEKDIKLKVNSKNGDARVILIKPDNTNKTLEEIQNPSDYELTLNKNELNEIGLYQVIAEFYALNKTICKEVNFSIANLSLNIDKEAIKVGEELTINIKIGSPVEEISLYGLEFGDGNQTNNFPFSHSVNEQIKHAYSKTGNYVLNLTAVIDGRLFSIAKDKISVESNNDTTAPDVKLIYPDDEEIIASSTIDFKYKVVENIKISRCEFFIYNTTPNGESDNVIYSENFTNIKNNSEQKVSLTDFDQGSYFWEVKCWDNSSNYDSNVNFFSVDLNLSESTSPNSNNTTNTQNNNTNSSYEKKEEIDYLKKSINEFLNKKDSLGPEEQEVIEDLEIVKNLQNYKKLLSQIEVDLKENIKFMSNEELKQKRLQEINDQLNEINNYVPQDVTVLDQKEYVKNTLDNNIGDVIKDYFASKKINIEKNALKKLTQYNAQNQNKLSVKTSIKKVEITINGSIKKITLISKKINVKDGNWNNILEVIPKEAIDSSDKITFLQKNKIIKKDPLIEFSSDDLNGKIVYYVNGDIDFDKLEKTDTVLFEEKLPEENRVVLTGFSVFDVLYSENPIYYFLLALLVIVLIYLGSFVAKKMKSDYYKKDPNVYRIMDLLADAHRALRENDLEHARANYSKIKEIYRVLFDDSKKFVYDKIKKLGISIDRRDIFNLVREYEESKRMFRKDDARRLYQDIQKIYMRLPKKDREIVYRRVFRDVFF